MNQTYPKRYMTSRDTRQKSKPTPRKTLPPLDALYQKLLKLDKPSWKWNLWNLMLALKMDRAFAQSVDGTEAFCGPPKTDPVDGHPIYDGFSKEAIEAAKPDAQRSAKALSDFIAEQLLLGNDKVLVVAGEAWPRVLDGRPFEKQVGKNERHIMTMISLHEYIRTHRTRPGKAELAKFSNERRIAVDARRKEQAKERGEYNPSEWPAVVALTRQDVQRAAEELEIEDFFSDSRVKIKG